MVRGLRGLPGVPSEKGYWGVRLRVLPRGSNGRGFPTTPCHSLPFGISTLDSLKIRTESGHK